MKFVIFIILCIYNIGFCDSSNQLYGNIQKSINDYEIGSRRFFNKNRSLQDLYNIITSGNDKDYPDYYKIHYNIYAPNAHQCRTSRGGNKNQVKQIKDKQFKMIAYDQDITTHKHQFSNNRSNSLVGQSILNEYNMYKFFENAILIQLKEDQEDIVFGETKEDFPENIRDKVFPFLYFTKKEGDIYINPNYVSYFYQKNPPSHHHYNHYYNNYYNNYFNYFKTWAHNVQTKKQLGDFNLQKQITNYPQIAALYGKDRFANIFIDFINYVECITKEN